MDRIRRIAAWPIEATGVLIGLASVALAYLASGTVTLADWVAGRDLDLDL
jgi:hypothetical protein